MNNEVNMETMDNLEGATAICDIPESDGGSFAKLLLGVLGAAAITGTTIVLVSKRKGKAKRKKLTKEEKMIAKLEAKGYVITGPLEELFSDEGDAVVETKQD